MKWKKAYKVPTKQGTFKMFISEHDGGLFYSSLLYWTVVGKRFLKVRGDDDGGYMDFKVETRVADSEQSAFEELFNWAQERFDTVGDPVALAADS